MICDNWKIQLESISSLELENCSKTLKHIRMDVEYDMQQIPLAADKCS